MSYETLKYDVIKKEAHLEIRRYQPFVTMTAPKPQTQGFMTLFRYISGDNETKQNIQMTVPVMTDLKEESFIAFTMPEKFVKSGYPKANHPNITFEDHHEKTYAAVRFKGLMKRADKYLNELKAYIELNQLISVGEPILLRYQGPYVPAIIRTHEILLEIKE